MAVRLYKPDTITTTNNVQGSSGCSWWPQGCMASANLSNYVATVTSSVSVYLPVYLPTSYTHQSSLCAGQQRQENYQLLDTHGLRTWSETFGAKLTFNSLFRFVTESMSNCRPYEHMNNTSATSRHEAMLLTCQTLHHWEYLKKKVFKYFKYFTYLDL